MNFDSYTDLGAQAAAELVNRLTPGWSGGRPLEAPAGAGARRRLAGEAEAAIWGRRGNLDSADVEGLFRLASRLRVIFESAAAGEADLTAQLVNSMLHDYHAAPQLAAHDREGWHLHFHSQEPEAGRAEARGAGCATALAVVIGAGGIARLGLCRATRCDRVYLDTSRNGSRRFCSERCLSRQKVASFRARRERAAAPGATAP